MNIARSISASLLVLFLLTGCDVNQNGDVMVEQAAALYEDGDYEAAVPVFKKALDKPLKEYPKSVALTMLGNCYNEMGEYEESIKYHEMAIEEDPQNHRAYVNKGVVCRLMGDFDEAEQMYNKALEIEPNYAELHISLGALYIHQEKYDQAVVELEKGVKLDDTLAVGHSNLAFAYATVGRFDDADRELKKAIVHGYTHPEVIRDRIEAFRAAAGEGAPAEEPAAEPTEEEAKDE
ncbi:tetratricopeptide repeat protein [Bremerella cremea]|uniref:tetratricopeptide repeat protein n=1 Tax=Bremerella cremea TaxID=1031537 RepID=UPI0031EC2232